MKDIKKLIFSVSGVATGFILAVALQIGIGGSASTSADAQLATEAPPIPVSAEAAAPVAGAPAAAPAPAPAPVPAAAPVDTTSHFVVDPAQSSAKILVAQTGLLGDSTLVGTGNNVTGDMFLTSSGNLGGPSGFQLDMRTMHSSDSALNTFLKNDVEPNKFPAATFAIESVSGIPANFADGNEFTFTMTGQQTMHGITRPATWTAKARKVGNFLTFAADTDFNMTDYGWTPPNYGVAKARNSVHLQVIVVAAIAP